MRKPSPVETGDLHSVLDAVAHPVWVTNPDGTPEFFNAAAADFFGSPAGELAAGAWADGFQPDDRTRLAAAWEEALRGTAPFAGEYRLCRADGTLRWHAVRGRPVLGSGGTVSRWVVTATDIDDCQRGQEAEGRLAAVVESSGDAITSCGPDGTILTWNPAAERLFGYSSAEIVGQSVYKLSPPDLLGEARQAVARVLRGEAVPTYETVRLTRDGRLVPVAVTPSAVRGACGAVVGFAAVYRDVTTQKAAEAALREGEQLLRTVLTNIPCGVFWKDRRSVYLGCNDQFARDHGLPGPTAVLARSELSLATPDEAAFYRECDLKVIETGQPLLNVEEPQTRPGGAKATLLTSKVPLRDAAGAVVGVLGVYQDVTERKRLEEQFRQAQRMEAIGRLASGVAHDFNNLLTVINGYADLALGTLSASDPARAAVDEVRKAGERATGLTRQLLAFSRKQVLRPRVFDLARLVGDLGAMLRRVVGEDVRVNVRAGPGRTLVSADPGQMEQVLMNLAVNARDAMPDGGALTIEVRNAALDGGRFDDSAEVRPGPYVVLAVSDTGCGMTDDVKARVFEPFFTTKDQGKGTGLGLATVYGIVRQSGGHIEIDTALGRGTTFRVYLPATAGSQVPEEVAVAPPAGGQETILLVEDDEPVRALALRVLQEAGYQVLDAGDGIQAIEAVEALGAAVDVLVTDVVLPGLGGRQLADRLAAGRPGLKVLYMSGHLDDAVVRRGAGADRVAFLAKPFTPAELARKVREILDQSRA